MRVYIRTSFFTAAAKVVGRITQTELQLTQWLKMQQRQGSTSSLRSFLKTHSKCLKCYRGIGFSSFLGHGENVDGVLIVFVRYKSSCCSCCCCWTGFCGRTLLYKFNITTTPHNKERRECFSACK